MVTLLVRFHLGDPLWQDAAIRPKDVPLIVVVLGLIVPILHALDVMLLERELEVEQTFGHESYHIVLGVADVEHKSLLVLEAAVFIIVFHSNCLCKHLLLCIITLLALFLLCIFLCWIALDLTDLGVRNFRLNNIDLFCKL